MDGRLRKVSIFQRLSEFPGQSLKESAGKIFCLACKEEQQNLKESLRRHVTTQKHKDRLEIYLKRGKSHGTLYSDMAEYFKANSHLKGASMSTDKHTFRYKVVQTFLLSGTPLSRMPHFAPVLEMSGITVGDFSDMAAQYIPLIEAREVQLLRSEVQDQFIGIQYDGTSRLGEAINVTRGQVLLR